MIYFIAVLQSFPCNIKTLEIFLRVNIPIAHVHSYSSASESFCNKGKYMFYYQVTKPEHFC